jgi:hypothetical protein
MLSIRPCSFPDGVKGFSIFEGDEKIAGPYQSEQYAQLQLVKLSLARKDQQPNPGQPDPNTSTYLKLQYLSQGILSGQITNKDMTDQLLEVLVSFESYYLKKGCLTTKQLEWCKSLVGKYNSLVMKLMKHGIKPVTFTAQTTAPQVEVDHRKYERVVEVDEKPRTSIKRGQLIKEDE